MVKIRVKNVLCVQYYSPRKKLVIYLVDFSISGTAGLLRTDIEVLVKDNFVSLLTCSKSSVLRHMKKG